MSELENIQKWFTSIMVRPGNLGDKISAADHRYGISSEQLIVGGKLSSRERIGIYARGYVLRLMECMRADYPALLHLMGEELFDMFARGYISKLPPQSPSLYDLGKHFPAYLEASQPAGSGGLFALPPELARAERARTEVFRAQGLEKEDNELPETDPMFYLFSSGKFKTSPCLRLLDLQYDLVDFVRAAEKGEAAVTPVREANLTAICRRSYAVSMHKLEPWQWHFLREIDAAEDQMTAVQKVASTLGIAADAVSAELMLWLPVALQRGYIYWED